MPRIDARRIVHEFEGPAHLSRRFTRDGYPISVKAIERWITCGRIPGDWLVILSIYAYRDGRQFLLHQYVMSDQDAGETPPQDMDYLD